MSYVISLRDHREIVVTDTNTKTSLFGDEMRFEYAGLSNDPITERFSLFSTPFQFEASATVLGDGFQMLAQTSGTVAKPIDIGRCPDNNSSYRIYDEAAPKRYYNYLVVEDSVGYTLFGFTSCLRFAGFFEIEQEGNERNVVAYLDGEDSCPQDWSHNLLESVVILEGKSLSELYQQYSDLIAEHHAPRHGVQQPAPIGWCSWYAYYADVTEQHIEKNVSLMTGELDKLEWVLLDDGYQEFMGDWLSPSDKFPSGIKAVVEQIRQQGKKPAIWLAPFIAQAESRIFTQHPDWFVRDHNKLPLKAEDVTYGGWRCTPWYVLDTSNEQVQEHLTLVVKTMREELGIELFKLDANYWGTLKGVRTERGVTGVEAYRMGMEAIAEGAGDALLLGCNAPMWPSLGLVDAMRVSDDVERHPHRFEQIAKETFYRSWQHRKLWQIDPDCATLVSLPNQATERRYYDFHRNVLLASGGLLLSGDPLSDMTHFSLSSLHKLFVRHKHNQEAAKFTSLSLNHAFLKLTDKNELHCLFNYHEHNVAMTLIADNPVNWYDYWTGEKLSSEAVKVIEIALENGLSSRAIFTAD